MSLLTIAVILVASNAFAQRSESPIRKIDFANFRFVGSIGHFRAEAYPRKSFTLRDGKFCDWRDGMTLRKLLYGDVTGDGAEEAIITFAVDTDGSAGVDQVYIYTMKNGHPTLRLSSLFEEKRR
jgi:hypothetical protein